MAQLPMDAPFALLPGEKKVDPCMVEEKGCDVPGQEHKTAHSMSLVQAYGK